MTNRGEKLLPKRFVNSDIDDGHWVGAKPRGKIVYCKSCHKKRYVKHTRLPGSEYCRTCFGKYVNHHTTIYKVSNG